MQRDGALGLGRLAGSTDAGTGLRAVSGGLALVDLDAPAAEVSQNAESLRVFAGHAGWEVGQLDDEIDSGGWFVVAGGLDDVFSGRPGTLVALGAAPAADAAGVAVHLPGRRRPELTSAPRGSAKPVRTTGRPQVGVRSG